MDYTLMFKQWLTHLQQNKPSLVSIPNVDELQSILDRTPNMSVDQAVHFPFLVGKASSMGYEPTTISNDTNLHSRHYGFRNEWWNLVGTVDGVPLAWQAWRRTLLPTEKHSVMKFAWSVNGITTYSDWIHDSVDSVFKYGDNNIVQSTSNDTVFPMNVKWEGIELLGLDNTTPMVMLHGNACLSCSDGIGVKMYMYPNVSNDTFSGSFTHAWESGVMPEGYTSNIALRSFNNIEQYFMHGQKSDQWASIHIHLENKVHIWAFFVSINIRKPHRIIIVNPDGSIKKLQQDKADFDRSKLAYQSMFSLHWSTRYSTTSEFITTLHQTFISGFWEGKPVQGTVIVETPDLRPYPERSREILEKFKSSMKISNFETSASDNLASAAIILLPILFGIFILLTIVYIVYKRRKQNPPWIRQQGLFPFV